MAKLFGEFLIEKNLVSVEQVLLAVITQLRSVPSTAEVIYDHALLPAHDQHRILVHQQYSGSDFRSSATSLGLWPRELAQKVSELVQVKRRPLGEVLVELGYLSLNTLTQALDSYIEASTTSLPPLLETAKSKSPNNSSQQTRIVEQNLDPVLIKEFIENYKTMINPALNTTVQKLEDPSIKHEELISLLRSTLSHFAALRAASTFLVASRTESLASELMTTFTNILNCADSKLCSIFDLRVLQDILKIAIHVFDAICVLMEEFNCEDGIDGDPNIIDLTQRLKKSQEHIQAQFNKNKQVV
ncbi:MAG: hypothetical protein KBD78_04395 [Oligoflexales bacterium]|nr:hypothetical protein [Oligoflexales bacterium]